MGPRPFSRGKPPSPSVGGRGDVDASMGPRPFSRGKTAASDIVQASQRASMGPRPFSRGKIDSRAMAARTCQASMGPRPFSRGKAADVGHDRATSTSLQWGRDLSVAERSGRRESRSAYAASMGPRPFSRGKQAVSWHDRQATSRSSFNGAATFQSRKARCSRGYVIGRLRRASMGPRPFSRGKARYRRGRCVRLTQLQWGRDLSVAESDGRTATRREHPSASMGPRPFSRGKADRHRSHAWSRDVASMGPRPFSRGKARRMAASLHRQRRFNGAATFQSRKGWPTMPAIADCRHASMGPRPFSRGKVGTARRLDDLQSRLQWGRDLSVAERSRPRADARDRAVGFNGAATFQSRKDVELVAIVPARVRASMGPRPFSRGKRRHMPAGDTSS